MNPVHHSADQRDTIAFALESKGLTDDAHAIRQWPRELTYWAASDALCNKWLRIGDSELLRSGLEALDMLLDYAAIADDSRRIVQLNMSRLALATGNRDRARTYLAAARNGKDKVIEKRIKSDPALRSATEDAGV